MWREKKKSSNSSIFQQYDYFHLQQEISSPIDNEYVYGDHGHNDPRSNEQHKKKKKKKKTTCNM